MDCGNFRQASPLDDHRIEATITSLMVANDVSGTFSTYPAEAAKNFAILWTHTMSAQSIHADHTDGPALLRKALIGNKGGRNYEVMLTRPLFVLLDSLEDETSGAGRLHKRLAPFSSKCR